MAAAASMAGTGGTVVSPAPRRAPRSRVDDVPTRRVIRDPDAAARADPMGADASRLEARDAVDGVLITPAAPASGAEAAAARPGEVVAGEAAAG
jgi:hypothetical protein